MEILLPDKYLQEKLPKTSIYKSGLVHDIYRLGNYVVKIPKTGFPDFNSEKHFLIEASSLDLLRKSGIPTPNKIQTSQITLFGKETHCLIETFIEGIQLSWRELNGKSFSAINDIYRVCHDIKIDGFGPINENKRGTFSTWKNYLVHTIRNSREHFNDIKGKSLNSLFDFLEEQVGKFCFSDIDYGGKFLLVDLNPGNIFFDQKGNLLSVIDIDHPMSGDVLFEYVSIYWYNREAFEKLQKHYLHLNQAQLKRLKLYLLVHACDVITWMSKHSMHIATDVDKLVRLHEITRKDIINK